MLEIDQEEEFNLKTIYGEKLYKKYQKNYPIIINEDILSWIRDKIDLFTNNGKKDPKNFGIVGYLKLFQEYCNFNNVDNPSELLDETIDNRNKRFMKYMKFLLNAKTEEEINKIKEIGFKKKPSQVTVTNLIQSRIKSFYSNRGKNITKGIKTMKTGENKNELLLNKSIIRKIQARIRVPNYRVICAFQSQLGLRISDILEILTDKDNKYSIEIYENYYYIKNFKTNKNEISINYLFLTKDLTNALLSVYGNICNNDLKKLNLFEILKTKNGNYTDHANFLNDLKRITAELGITENIRTHSLRKYFSSQVRKCKKVDDEFKEHLMGHASFNLSQAYNNNLKDINWYFNEWLKLEEFINVNIINTTNEDIKEIKEMLYEKDREIKEIKRENENIKEALSIFSKFLLSDYYAVKSYKAQMEGKDYKEYDDKSDIPHVSDKDMNELISKIEELNLDKKN